MRMLSGKTMDEFGKAYWSEYADKIISTYNMKKTGKDHYNSPCPKCGGRDRFYISNIDGIVFFNCNQGCTFTELKEIMESDGAWVDYRKSEDFSGVIKYMEVAENPFKDLTPEKPLPYHLRKGVGLNGAMLDGDTLVIRITNIRGENVGTQTITHDGQKRFSPGMDKEGAFGVINGPLKDTCYITEGWATGCSVSEAMNGAPVVFGLDAGNLPKVVEQIKAAKPDIRIIVAADNDEKGIEAAEKTNLQYVMPQEPGQDFNDVHAQFGLQKVRHIILNGNQKKSLFSKIGSLELRRPEWHIEGILEKQALAAGFGAPAAGKTFVLLDMALSIAAGKDYHGRKVEQSTVFYIAGEGHNGFVRRCRAWSKVHNVPLDDLPFFKSNRAVIFSDEAQLSELHNTIKEMIKEYGKPGIICVDTLARSMGSDENSTKDMNLFIAACDSLKDEFDCTVVLAHHTGLQEKQRARGSSALLGALDCEFRIERVGDHMTTVEFTKMKDAPEPPKMAFMQVAISLMTDDGMETSSICLEECDAPSSRERNVQDVIMEEYDKLRASEGDKWVSRSVLKVNVSLETGKSQRQCDRDIKRMIDDQRFVLNNNKLAWS